MGYIPRLFNYLEITFVVHREYLPFSSLNDAESWIETVDAALGYPKNGTQTHSLVVQNGNKTIVLSTIKGLPYMSEEQIDSLMTHEEAVASGHIIIPDALDG